MPGDFQTCMDLENMFFHVKIHEEHQKFLGFSVPDPSTGNPIYFQFAVMIYGLNPAVFIVTTLTKPLVAFLHTRGVRYSIMIDDGRVLGRTSEECWEHHQYTIETFNKAGWNIQVKKTSTSPTQQLYHQGFTTDTENMTYSIPDFKLQNLKTEISKVCSQQNKHIPIKTLSKCVGKISSCLRAIGPISRVMLRSSHYLISEATEGLDPSAWGGSVMIHPQVAQDLQFIANNLDTENGQPIINESTGVSLNSILTQDLQQDRLLRPVSDSESMGGLLASDSSDFMKFAYEVSGQSLTYRELMSQFEQDQSSSFREISAIKGALLSNPSYFTRQSVSIYYWMTDSTCAVIWLTKGSRVKAAQQLIIDIFRLLFSYKARIVPIWVPRTTNELVLADMGSKFRDTDDWGINQEAFQTLERMAGTQFTADCFAYSTNARCPKYYSAVMSPHCSGINAFQQTWGGDYNYVCPPVKLVIDTFKHLLADTSQGVMVVPYWPTDLFWPVLTIDGSHLREIFYKHHIFHPRLVTGELCDKSYFSTRARAPMIALFYNSSINQTSVISRHLCIMGGCHLCH